MEYTGHQTDKIIDNLTKYNIYCQKYNKSTDRFKFKLKENATFNYSILIDIMYIEGNSILHVVNKVTKFQVTSWLSNVSAKHIWETLQLCLIDVYIGPPDLIIHDACLNFVRKEFYQYAILMAIAIKTVPIKAH